MPADGLRGQTIDEGVNYYHVLDVPYTATKQEITRAYRLAMKKAHPDRAHPERRPAAEERAKLINRAFTTLSKPESRRAYDLTIKDAAVQDQIMNRYFGGFNAPGEHAHDPLGEALRREKTAYEKAEGRQANRSAFISILVAFGGIAAIVVGVLLLWALIESAFRALV